MADDTPKTTIQPGGLLNLEAVVKFLQVARVDQLDGLYEAVCDKLQALGSGPAKRGAHKAYKLEEPASPGGSIRGILRYVQYCTGDEAIGNLQTIEAVIRSRHSAAGYKPKKTVVGEKDAPYVQPKPPGGKKDVVTPQTVNVLNPEDKEAREKAAK